MNDAEATAFVEAYAAAFNRLDADAIAAFYDEPACIVDAGTTGVFEARDGIRANMVLLLERYRSLGFVEARADRVETEHLGSTMRQVDVAWTLRVRDGAVGFGTRYWLVDRGGGPHIAAVLAHDEHAALDDLG